jgi:hypothetical protein
MRIRGVEQQQVYTRLCELPRPDGEVLALTMSPLPLGFSRRLREYGLWPPIPPSRVARDAGGRPVRDERGQALTVGDDRDPEYRRDLELYHQRVAVLSVLESLRDDSNISFEAPRPAGNTGWIEYADAVHAEMESAGFTAGDLVHLCSFACRMSNLAGGHLREAQEHFSQVRHSETG